MKRASYTEEDYLKALYDGEPGRGEGVISMQTISSAMGVTPGTATSMAKNLAAKGYIEYLPRVGCRLTMHGRATALDVIRRHRIVESFLVRVLGFPWTEVHEEAELLEHAVSGRLLERMDEMLGHPAVDPHGDPIPDREGKYSPRETVPLSRCREGSSVTILRIRSQDPAFLEFAQSHDLIPGIRITLERLDAAAETVRYRKTGGTESRTIGLRAAEKILIDPEGCGAE